MSVCCSICLKIAIIDLKIVITKIVKIMVMMNKQDIILNVKIAIGKNKTFIGHCCQ